MLKNMTVVLNGPSAFGLTFVPFGFNKLVQTGKFNLCQAICFFSPSVSVKNHSYEV